MKILRKMDIKIREISNGYLLTIQSGFAREKETVHTDIKSMKGLIWKAIKKHYNAKSGD